MLIINADDFGRSVAETNAALQCYTAGRITSVSAMVFMADSERAAELANAKMGWTLDCILIFPSRLPMASCRETLRDCHNRIVRFLEAKQIRADLIQSIAAKGICLFVQGTSRGVHAIYLEEPTITHRRAPSHASCAPTCF